MASLIERLRARPENKPVYTEDDVDEHHFLPDQTTEQPGPVSPLTNIERILDCEMRPTLSDNPVPEQVFVKQYYVKWKGLSYLHCSWVPVQVFEEAYVSIPRSRLKSRVDKFDSEKESLSSKEDFVAVRPEWTIVDRILSSRGEGDLKEYLVKFKGLPYDECYWEYETYISTFQKEIQRFKDINLGSRRDKCVGLDKNHKDFELFEHTPEFLTGMLHPFQLEGLNFLRFSWSNKTHVILADEMGLGKTIQSIAFLASLFEENQAPYLVVAPLSTLPNWEREFATWAPHMNVVMYSGSSEARTVIREHEFYFPKGYKTINSQIGGESKQDRIKFDVLLTSFEKINKDTTFLKPIKWKCMIVDEGHRLKNMDSKLFASLKQYSSKHRVLLTGTPLQNNLDELFVLMHFLDAGKFGSLEEFQKEFKDINNEEQISRLHKMLGPHMLRRLKEDVLKDMPPKKELIVRVDLSNQQKEYYKAILTRNFQILGKKGGVKVSNVLMELRKVCLHPYMVEGVEPDIQDPNEAFKQLLESSGKMQLLDKMMVKLKEQGHRVLIYTQFQHMLDLLEDYCAYKNWFYERIEGNVVGGERQVRIDRFNAKNSNRFCFLLSTRAGGIGINLATADTVILYDSDWNPHADLQAMARAHRLGQKNKVMIYRLINRGTVEEKMMEMTKKKLVLEHLVVGKLKEENINQKELDDIIRYGSKELFAKENEEAGKSGKIHYDDAAIEKLLDRDHADAEEVSFDVVEKNGFLNAFKVATFECIDEEEAPESEKAQAIENESSTSNPDRASYWEELLKDRYEAHQAEELNALGKRKRSCKQMLPAEDDDDGAGLEENSDEDCEIQQNDDDDDGDDDDEEEAEQAEKKNHTARKPTKRRRARDNSERRPLMEGEGKSLMVLGFSQKERVLFMKTLMRYGVGNYDWKEFENPFQKKKTYAEIKDYGILLLRHITEDTQDDSPTFSDGVPKEGLKRGDVLERLAIIMLINEKIKNMEDHPTKPVFPNRILDRFPGLKTGRCWKEEHDKILIRALYKHGYRKWQEVANDKELGIQEVICKELRFPYINLNAAEEAAWEESSLKRKNNKAANNKNASADGVNISSLHHYKDMQKRLVEFVTKRGHLLEKAINYEYAEEYYGTNGSVMMCAEQVEGETKVTDDTVGAGVVETDNEMLDQLPQRETINPEEISAAAVDNKQERVEVAQLYNKMCKNLNENSGKSVRTYVNCQAPSQKLKNIFRPLESISENMKKSVSVTGTDHDVEMRDSVHESTLGSCKFMDLTMEEEAKATTKEVDVEMGGVDVIILDD